MESQIYNHEYNNRIAEYKMEIKKKKMQQNDEQIKITLTQWTHANVVKFIFDLYWRVPLERHLLSTVYSLQRAEFGSGGTAFVLERK